MSKARRADRQTEARDVVLRACPGLRSFRDKGGPIRAPAGSGRRSLAGRGSVLGRTGESLAERGGRSCPRARSARGGRGRGAGLAGGRARSRPGSGRAAAGGGRALCSSIGASSRESSSRCSRAPTSRRRSRRRSSTRRPSGSFEETLASPVSSGFAPVPRTSRWPPISPSMWSRAPRCSGWSRRSPRALPCARHSPGRRCRWETKSRRVCVACCGVSTTAPSEGCVAGSPGAAATSASGSRVAYGGLGAEGPRSRSTWRSLSSFSMGAAFVWFVAALVDGLRSSWLAEALASLGGLSSLAGISCSSGPLRARRPGCASCACVWPTERGTPHAWGDRSYA